MSITKRIAAKIVEYIPTKILNIEAGLRSSGGKDKISGKLNHESFRPMVFDLEEYRNALSSATNPDDPNRSDLMAIYESCELDDHLMTVIENQILKLQGTPFKLTANDKDADKEVLDLLKKPWFLDFIKYTMQSVYTGTKVIELFELKENLELKEVDKVDESFIDFKKKKIYKDAIQREEGWIYNELPYKNYYIQVGKDNDLGVMSKLAVAVLFKKLVIGSWLDYIEKYGVPPRWVITDREDDERFDELYDMMKDMVSNQFAVLRGKETIEIMPTPGTDAYQVFDKFLDRMDAGITKRIAGATGTVDEKAFVGAAKVHQDTEASRHWAHKIFVAYIINEELLPRLALISPAYSALANYKFEWDDDAKLSLKEIIEAIDILAKHFNLDIKEIEEKTGFKILSQKSELTKTEPTPTGGDGEGKK